MNESLRFGIIGAGLMGVEHIQNIALLEDASVAAIADPHPPSQERALAAAGGELQVYDDYAPLLADESINAVIIATPNHTHAAVLRDVFETDKHILCEKPLCTTLDDCAWVVAEAARRSQVFWVAMEYRYSPPVARFVREVQAGTAGRLRMLSIREHRFPFLKKVGDWNRFNRNSGGTLVEKSCHHFDLMRHVVGAEPLRVFATGGADVNHLDEEYDGEQPDIIDNALVVVDFENGVRAVHDLCMFAEGSRHMQELAATGDTGKVECLMPPGQVVLGRRIPRAVETIDVAVPDDVLAAGYHHGATYYELRDFQRAAVEGAPVAVTAEDGMKAVAMGVAAQISIAEQRVVLMSELGL